MRALNIRVVFGFLVSPAIPAIVIYAWQLLASKKSEAEWGATVFLIFGYIAALIFGAPAYLLLRYLRITSLRAYLLAGFSIGALAGILIFLPDVVRNWNSNYRHAILLLINGFPLMGGAAGLLASWVFWLLSVRGARSNEGHENYSP
ncbi:hypothetical protein [Burkholderia pseudomallei]